MTDVPKDSWADGIQQRIAAVEAALKQLREDHNFLSGVVSQPCVSKSEMAALAKRVEACERDKDERCVALSEITDRLRSRVEACEQRIHNALDLIGYGEPAPAPEAKPSASEHDPRCSSNERDEDGKPYCCDCRPCLLCGKKICECLDEYGQLRGKTTSEPAAKGEPAFECTADDIEQPAATQLRMVVSDVNDIRVKQIEHDDKLDALATKMREDVLMLAKKIDDVDSRIEHEVEFLTSAYHPVSDNEKESEDAPVTEKRRTERSMGGPVYLDDIWRVREDVQALAAKVDKAIDWWCGSEKGYRVLQEEFAKLAAKMEANDKILSAQINRVHDDIALARSEITDVLREVEQITHNDEGEAAERDELRKIVAEEVAKAQICHCGIDWSPGTGHNFDGTDSGPLTLPPTSEMQKAMVPPPQSTTGGGKA